MSEKLIMAITAAVGITLAVGIGYYWWSSEPATVVVEQETSTPKPPPMPPQGAEAVGPPTPRIEPQVVTEAPQIEAVATEETKQLDTCNAGFLFMVSQKSSEPKPFVMLRDALADLRSAEGEATLSITFEKCLTASLDQGIFRRFLARVGDYIFVQRVLFFDIKNWGEVLREPEFMRVNADDLKKRGNISFGEIGNKHLAVQIRGLANQVDQVEIVADLLMKAILHPAKIIDQPELEVAQLLNRFEKQIGQVEPLHADLLDALEVSAIYKQAKFEVLGINSNWHSFLPNVDFSKIPGISQLQKENLNQQNKQFFGDIDRHILNKVDPNIDYDDNQFAELLMAHHDWLMARVKQWTAETDLSTIIFTSLLRQ